MTARESTQAGVCEVCGTPEGQPHKMSCRPENREAAEKRLGNVAVARLLAEAREKHISNALVQQVADAYARVADALAAKDAEIARLKAVSWVQCTTLSNECLGGCRSMAEHDRYRHRQLKAERDADLQEQHRKEVGRLEEALLQFMSGDMHTMGCDGAHGAPKCSPRCATARAALRAVGRLP